MFCEKCGAEMKQKSKFCPKCGNEIGRFTKEQGACGKEKSIVQVQSDVKIKQDTQNDKKKNGNLEEVMSVWDYLWIFMLASIPVIGTIIVIVNALGSSNKNKTNYCRAIILGQVLLILIVIMFWSSLVGILYSLAY